MVLRNDGQVLCCAISPSDPDLVCTGNQSDHAVLFKLRGKDEQPTRVELRGHTDSVVHVHFSNDGLYVATGSYDGTVRVWTAADGALLHVLSGPASEVEWIRWHPKGHALLAGSADCTAWMWWAPTGKVMQVLAGHADKVNAGCFANGGKSIATGAQSGEVIVWNPRAGTAVHNIQLHATGVLTLESHPTEPVVVTGSFDGECAVINIETGKKLATLKGHENEVESVAFFPGNLPFLATGGIDGTIRIYDSNKWELRLAVTAHQEIGGGVTRLYWHPTEPIVFSAGTDNMVRVHDARTGQQTRVLSGHRQGILDCATTMANGAVRLLTASDDKTGRIFTI